tara:strand:- start:187 stop:348 length:162 start_codon:yes stop_codon:yes gene_type:complete
MKKQYQEYTGEWLEYRSELEDLLIDSIIDNNYLFFKECLSWGIPPVRAVNFYL